MNSRTIESLVAEMGGHLVGASAKRAVSSVAPPDEAGPEDVTLYLDLRWRSRMESTRAALVLTTPELAQHVIGAGVQVWIHQDAPAAMVTLIDSLHPPVPADPPTWNGNTGCAVARTADVARDVEWGPGCVIHARVRLEPGCHLGAHVVVREGASLGTNCRIGDGSWIGPATELGRRVTVGPGSAIGVEGFGLRRVGAVNEAIRHVGKVEIGDDSSIGARTVVARGTVGRTVVGRGTHIDASVHIGHNTHIGEDCVISGLAGLAGSVRLGRGVLVGGQAGIADHVTVGDCARIAARAAVAGDVPAGATVEGHPAVSRWTWNRMMATLKRSVEE